MKSILLGKHHDITAFSSKEKSRYLLQSVHYNQEKKCVEATDARIFVRVPVVESDEFPPVGSDQVPVDTIIPADSFAEALANIDKSSIPALEYAKLESNGKVILTTTDLDTERSVTCKPLEGNYPKLDQVIPDWEPAVTIGISAILLKQISDYALKHSCDSCRTVRFEFKSDLDSFRFSINLEDLNGPTKATGLGMPVRLT